MKLRIRRRRLVVATLVAAIAVCVGVPGFAASASWTSKNLGANTAAISRCDSDGVTEIQNISGANVSSVTIGNIAAACGNGSISVTVDNGTVNSSGSGTVAAGGGSITLNLAVAVPAKDSDSIDVSITGP